MESERILGKRSYARSGAPELLESGNGEVDDDGDDKVDDKERRRLHPLCEIEMRGLDGRAVCQCWPPTAQGHWSPRRREDGGERGESQRGERERRK
jgi:hypothetical protein